VKHIDKLQMPLPVSFCRQHVNDTNYYIIAPKKTAARYLFELDTSNTALQAIN
jgi:hypothetical protein